MMRATVCTLFEGSYHYGVAALANSLHRAGFKGLIYAGMRGDLPPWAEASQLVDIPMWPGARTMLVDEHLQIIFLPLNTDYHLTNYKPQFMLDLMHGPAVDSEAIFYFDPDICVARDWEYFEQWVECGVAMCEDVNSPMSENHPHRVGWRRFYANHGLTLRFRESFYMNGGFVGLRRSEVRFLVHWMRTIELMSFVVGPLSMGLGAKGAYRSVGFAECFLNTDQDALNAAVEASDTAVSIIGKSAMAFSPGTACLPHAVGFGKPWQRNYTAGMMRGYPPRLIDKLFWQNMYGPIKPFSVSRLFAIRLQLSVASLVGRFYRRN